MAGVVECLDLMGETIESILDFVAQDKVLGYDFEQYLTNAGLEDLSEKEFNNAIIQYALDMKMQNGIRVLDYYKQTFSTTLTKTQTEVIDSLKNSIISVFRIEKKLSNAFIVKNIASEGELELLPMVKMCHLKEIGKYDYVLARAVEYQNIFYILEIIDVISEYNPAFANRTALGCMLQNPVCAYFKNDKKRLELEEFTKHFHRAFLDYFNSDFVITTNKKADNLILKFENYYANDIKEDYKDLIETPKTYRFFKIEEYEQGGFFGETDAYIKGFSEHEETYDIALFSTEKQGLYAIPFFATFLKCFENEAEIEGASECIKSFLTDDRVPPEVLTYCYNKYKDNFIKTINDRLNSNYSTLDEIVSKTKAQHLEGGIFSPINLLYNSKIFFDMIKTEENI